MKRGFFILFTILLISPFSYGGKQKLFDQATRMERKHKRFKTLLKGISDPCMGEGLQKYKRKTNSECQTKKAIDFSGFVKKIKKAAEAEEQKQENAYQQKRAKEEKIKEKKKAEEYARKLKKEMARKAKEEAIRKAKEEALRKKRLEAERKARIEAARRAKIKARSDRKTGRLTAILNGLKDPCSRGGSPFKNRVNSKECKTKESIVRSGLILEYMKNAARAEKGMEVEYQENLKKK